MDSTIPTDELARLRERFVFLACSRYRLRHATAEDLAQAALLTFLEVRHRYPREEEHPRILTGIFRNKCREHIATSIRNERKRKDLMAVAEKQGADEVSCRPESTPDEGVLGDILQREASGAIERALAELREPAREMFQLIARHGLSRRDLIRHYGLNRNTLDSRLRVYRRELREALQRHGVDV